MKLSIPRGIVYHDLTLDVRSLIKSVYAKLDDEDVIREFEGEFAGYMGVRHCVAFPLARTAVYFALKSQDLPAGSEIIMPPITIKSMLDVVLALDLKPVVVDIDPDSLCFDVTQLKHAINAGTRAVLITYLFGLVPDCEEMIQLCKQNDLFIIEDFSQCLNGEFAARKVGTFGDIGIYSSSSIKTFDIYGGGLVVCDQEALYSKLLQYQSELSAASRILLLRKIGVDLMRNLATRRYIFHFVVFPLIKLVSLFSPMSVMKLVGGRSEAPDRRMPSSWFSQFTSFQAGVGLELLHRVRNEDQARVENVRYIKSGAKSLNCPTPAKRGSNVYWQFVAYFDDPIKAQKAFMSHGVDTATTSLALIAALPAYARNDETPNARRLHAKGLFIPSYPRLSRAELQRIADAANQAAAPPPQL